MDPATLRSMATLGYQQWQNQTRQPAQPANPQPAQATQPKNPFGLPEFDRRYLNFVTNGPNGLEAIPGAPIDAVFKVQEYREKLLNAQYDFFENPNKFLGDLVREEAKKQAAEVFQQQFGSHQQQQTAQQILQENAGWLYEQQNGRTVTQYNPATGQHEPQLSAWGNVYLQSLNEASGLGIQDAAGKHKYAMAVVERAALQAKLQAANPAGQNPAAPASPPPPPAIPGWAPPPPPAANPAVPMSLRDMFKANFDKAGLTDDALRNQINAMPG